MDPILLAPKAIGYLTSWSGPDVEIEVVVRSWP